MTVLYNAQLPLQLILAILSSVVLVLGDTPDQDDCDALEEGSYDVPKHIFAIILVLIVSALGAATPVLGVRFPWLRIPPLALEIGKHFGTGVVLATGFIHLLPDALMNLTDPCLPEPIREYPALTGVLTLVAALLFQLIEFLANIYSAGHSHSHSHSHGPIHPVHSATPTLSAAVTQIDGVSMVPDEEKHRKNQHGATEEGSIASTDEKNTPISASRRISTYMLEFGIALHSIFVGLALGTSEGADFVTLLIALCFHQFFEGIALGSRIAELPYQSVWLPLGNAILVASTTPLGAVFGMGIRSVYRARSAHTLIIQGVLNAISSGMLIYTSLVNLIAEEFAQPAFVALPGRYKFLYMMSLYFGAAGMGLVGLWA
ncbi:hypothetical protein IWQ62_005070 [Dispira parvispora]|uniref:Zinc/iron permease n=1 Tax=Dispira parvispora TaxID=1520584 RepID=A0A9W8ARJ0_9FUNG|nr:hypothetical protein IWQ62_005070 [Dispira parvispora]